MKDILNKLISSLDNTNTGFSGKKLTAFSIVACVLVAHIKWISLDDFKHLEMVLTIDYAFIATLFGINVVDKKKNPTE